MQHDSRLERILRDRPDFSHTIDIRFVTIEVDRVVAEITATPALANRNGVMHGGAIMSLADDVAGVATIYCLPEEQTAVTLESKTNFLRAIEIGDTVRAEATPMHKGRKTMVWQVQVSRGDGKPAAYVTQTLLVVDRNS